MSHLDFGASTPIRPSSSTSECPTGPSQVIIPLLELMLGQPFRGELDELVLTFTLLSGHRPLRNARRRAQRIRAWTHSFTYKIGECLLVPQSCIAVLRSTLEQEGPDTPPYHRDCAILNDLAIAMSERTRVRHTPNNPGPRVTAVLQEALHTLYQSERQGASGGSRSTRDTACALHKLQGDLSTWVLCELGVVSVLTEFLSRVSCPEGLVPPCWDLLRV